MNFGCYPSSHLRLYRFLYQLSLALGILLVAVSAHALDKPPYPVIFIHGINGGASDWDNLGSRLVTPDALGKHWTYGGSPTLVSGAVSPLDISVRGNLVSGDFYTLQFSSNDGLTFGQQGWEIAQIIAKVKILNNTSKVILVGHSMGGLAARAYLQNYASLTYSQNYASTGPTISYRGDVAKLITVGTPHLGSLWPDICQNTYASVYCWGLTMGHSTSSIAMNSLKPESGALTQLNSSVLQFADSPNGLPKINYTSIVVFGTLTNGGDGDGIVLKASQSLASLDLSSDIKTLYNEGSVDIEPFECQYVQTHTCEPQNLLVEAYIAAEVLATPLATPPYATTLPPDSNISGTSATLNGRIYPVGKSATAWFEWGTTSALGNKTLDQPIVAGINSVSISETLSGLVNNTTYYYRVVASNVNGTSPPAPRDPLQFTTPTVGVPSLPAPSLLLPDPYAWSQSTTPNFSWSPLANAASYRIMVATDPKALPTDKSSKTCPGCAVNDSSNSPDYVPSAGKLMYSTLYWWQVRGGMGANDYGDWSVPQVFATAPTPTVSLPAAPTQTAPDDNATVQTTMPTLSWTPVAGATSYRIMIAPYAAALTTDPASADCPACVTNAVVPGAQGTTYVPYTGLLAVGTTYYWSVTASSPDSYGNWSAVRTFTTAIAQPAPTIIFQPYVITLSDGTTQTVSTFYLSGALFGDVELRSGTIDLNGQTLTIYGNLIQSGGVLNVNGGTLVVKGDYRIQSYGTDATGKINSYGTSSGILHMTQAADSVVVNGQFVMYSTSYSSTGYLTAGVLEVKGDFTQKGLGISNGSINFASTGTHKVLLSGANQQTVSFDYPGSSSSHFNILEITNSSAAWVVFSTKIVVSSLFDHHQNRFTVSVPSDFPDYDGDGVRDNIDAYPTNASLWNVVYLGDINNDGRIDMTDAIMALQIMSGITPKNTVYKEADVNSNGKIGMQEVLYVMQKAAGLR